MKAHDDKRKNIKKYVSLGDIPRNMDSLHSLNDRVEEYLQNKAKDNTERDGKRSIGIKKFILSLCKRNNKNKYNPLNDDGDELTEKYSPVKNVSYNYKKFGK